MCIYIVSDSVSEIFEDGEYQSITFSNLSDSTWIPQKMQFMGNDRAELFIKGQKYPFSLQKLEDAR